MRGRRAIEGRACYGGRAEPAGRPGGAAFHDGWTFHGSRGLLPVLWSADGRRTAWLNG